MVIPTDLLKVYAAKKVFDRLFDWYEQCRYANEDQAKKKLTDVWLWDPEALRKRIRAKSKYNMLLDKKKVQVDVDQCAAQVAEALEENFENEINYAFKKRGPYFMVNLTLAMSNMMQRIRVPDSSNYRENCELDAVRTIWNEYIAKLSELNSSTYDIYTQVIASFKSILDETSAVLTDTSETFANRTKTYSWTPLETDDGKRSAGLQFIDELMSEETINAVTERFQQHLLDMRAAWTDLSSKGTFNAAAAIRKFITDEFGQIVVINLQDFASKCFTGSKDAVALTQDSSGNDVPTAELQQAATEIARKLKDKAEILAQADGRHAFTGANDANFLMMPHDTPHLNALILAQCPGFKAYTSENSDSFSLFYNYLSLPLYVFNWTLKGEKAYAVGGGADAIGQHMDEASRNWCHFPNLINRDLWDQIEPGYTFAQETQLAEYVGDMLDRAKEYGLVEQTGSEYNVLVIEDYEIHDAAGTRLAKARQPLGNANSQDMHVAAASEIYAKVAHELFEKLDSADKIDEAQLPQLLPTGTFIQRVTKPTCCRMNSGTSQPKPGWEWALTRKFMRKMYDTCLMLQRTIGVIDALRGLVRESNENLRKGADATNKQGEFAQYYGLGLVDFQEEEKLWIFEDVYGNEQELICAIDLKPWQRPYHVYFMMERFVALPEEVFAHWAEQYEALARDKRVQIQQRQEAMLATLKETGKDTTKIAFASAVKSGAGSNQMVEPIRTFYRDIITQFGG